MLPSVAFCLPPPFSILLHKCAGNLWLQWNETKRSIRVYWTELSRKPLQWQRTERAPLHTGIQNDRRTPLSFLFFLFFVHILAHLSVGITLNVTQVPDTGSTSSCVSAALIKQAFINRITFTHTWCMLLMPFGANCYVKKIMICDY